MFICSNSDAVIVIYLNKGIICKEASCDKMEESIKSKMAVRYPDTDYQVNTLFLTAKSGDRKSFDEQLEKLLKRADYIAELGHTLLRKAPE